MRPSLNSQQDGSNAILSAIQQAPIGVRSNDDVPGQIGCGPEVGQALSEYRGRNAVVLALPRGGVPVAAEVAAALDAPLDLILVRKIGVPTQPELAMGAVVDGTAPVIVRNEEVIELSGTTADEFDAACASELEEIERRRQLYIGDRARVEIAGQVVIVIDDGIATGATTRAALQAIRNRKPKELVSPFPSLHPTRSRNCAGKSMP